MRILVAAGTGAARPRLAHAAAGLALRGHVVRGLDPAPAGGDAGHEPNLAAAGDEPVDVVLGAAAAVRAVALAGALAGARVMVLDFGPAATLRWSVADRLAWGSLYGAGLVAPADADGWRTRRDVDLERLGLWPEGEPASAPDATHADSEILERACERALARHRGRAARSAVFLDRDGTLVIERGYLADPGELALLPATAAALRRLHAAGHALVVISNQSGVGRGLFPLSSVYAAMAALRRALRAEGVELDGIYFCPHRPDAGCGCRKPGIELLERAADDLVLDLRGSVMIGDKLLDVATGHRAGARGILVRTGYGRDEEARLGGPGEPRPDRVADDLGGAADWVLSAEGLGEV